MRTISAQKLLMLDRQAAKVIGKHGRLPLSRLASYALQIIQAFRRVISFTLPKSIYMSPAVCTIWATSTSTSSLTTSSSTSRSSS